MKPDNTHINQEIIKVLSDSERLKAGRSRVMAILDGEKDSQPQVLSLSLDPWRQPWGNLGGDPAK